MRKVRIGFLLPRYSPRSKSLMPAVVQALAADGAIVDILHPVDAMVDLSALRVEHDLYVLRQWGDLALSMAGALHELGASIVNHYPVTNALRDKIVTARVLQAAGIPMPRTCVASHPDQLASMLDDGPIIVKPFTGGNGIHIQIIRSLAELLQVDRHGEPVFAQRYHPHDGWDRKIYVIGGELFGVKRIFPRRTEADRYGEPFMLTPELRDIAVRCGQAFGIDLYGVDIIESEGQPYVVDMCSIPGFKGVPDAVPLLARYLYEAAERSVRGEPVLESPAALAPRSELTTSWARLGSAP
jgi:ribosomal protein S6--L-glutamate ligase